MQCRRGLGTGQQGTDLYEDPEYTGSTMKSFVPRESSSPYSVRIGVASFPVLRQPGAAYLVEGATQPRGVQCTRTPREDQPVQDVAGDGSRTERDLLELSLGALAGRVAQVS